MDSFSFSELNKPEWTRKLLIFVVGFSLLLPLLTLSSYFWDKYRVIPDVHNFYWMARAQDPTLFARDYLYITSWQIIEANIFGFHMLFYPLSLGYGLFFYLANTIVDYVWLTKIEIVIIVIVCAIYMFKLGKTEKDNLTGLSLSLLFLFFMLASPQSISIFTGIQRSFALPLMIIFLYYTINQNYIKAGLTIFISTLIYLPVVPPMFIVYILSVIKIKPHFKLSLNITRSKLIIIFITLLFSIFTIVLALAAQRHLLPPAIGTTSTTSFLPDNNIIIQSNGGTINASNPDNQQGGAVSLFLGFPLLGRAGIFDMGADVINFLVMLILSFLTYKSVGSKALKRIPVALWYLLAAGIIMYATAMFFIFELSSFALYLPSRYTRSTLFLFMLCFIGLNWIDFLSKLPIWLLKNIRLILFFFISFGLTIGTVYIFSINRPLLLPIMWIVGIIIIGVFVPIIISGLLYLTTTNLSVTNGVKYGAIFIATILILYLSSIYTRTLGLKVDNPSVNERNVYEFVASLPKETVLAGDPNILTNIPLFSQRSVLFRYLFPKNAIVIVNYLDAQYSEEPQAVLDFCQRYDIAYLVLDKRKFTEEYMSKKDFFFSPWNDMIIERIAGRSDFFLPTVQPVFSSDPFMVIECNTETILSNQNQP